MSPAQMTLDGNKLKNIAHASHTATVTATSLAMRERLRHSSDITRTKSKLIRDGEKIVDEDYRQFWKDLEAAGVGSIVYGRKGKADRFEWHFSLKSVGKSMLEGTNEKVDKISKSNGKAMPIAKSRPMPAPERAIATKGHKLVFIPLRKDFNLEISLPADVTKSEVEVINSALKRLSA